MPDLTPQIEAAAQSPASATSDGQSATARPISDLIKADQYLAAKNKVKNKGPFGLIRQRQIIHPGPIN